MTLHLHRLRRVAFDLRAHVQRQRRQEGLRGLAESLRHFASAQTTEAPPEPAQELGAHLLPPGEALALHAEHQFRQVGFDHDPAVVRRLAHQVLHTELLPSLRAAIYTHTEPHGPYLPGGGGQYPTSFELASEEDERHHAQAVHAARVRWEKEKGLVRGVHRPVSVVAVLHRPPGAEDHIVGYPHHALRVYGNHLSVLSKPAQWYPGDTHNLHAFGMLHPMSPAQAAVMAATEGMDEDPLDAGIPGGSEYPEGLVLGGLHMDDDVEHRHHLEAGPLHGPEAPQWHPAGLSYGAWRVLKALGK